MRPISSTWRTRRCGELRAAASRSASSGMTSASGWPNSFLGGAIEDADAIFNSSTSRNAMRRLVESATQSSMSGTASPHLLVGAPRAQGIRSGKVDQVDSAAGRRTEQAGFALDRNPWVIRNFLAASGKGVEDGRLAAVRVTESRKISRTRLLDGAHSPVTSSQSNNRVSSPGSP